MRTAESKTKKAVLFDMGSVLIGWEVRPPFRPHFRSEEDLDVFLRTTFREIFDAVHDGEGSMAECLRPVRLSHPEAIHLIDLYETNWAAFITGVMEETVAIVQELHAAGVALYGGAKAGLDFLARGLRPTLREHGVRVLVIRPGFVHTRMTEGLSPAPLSTDPESVARDIVRSLRRSRTVVWTPRLLRPMFAVLRLLPSPIWNRLAAR